MINRELSVVLVRKTVKESSLTFGIRNDATPKPYSRTMLSTKAVMESCREPSGEGGSIT